MKYKHWYTCLLLWLPACLAAQTNIYVSTTGVDAFGNGSIGNPYRTISFAVQQAPATGIVNVTPGIYNETSVIYISKALTVKKTGSGQVVIDASARTPVPGSEYMLAVVSTSNVTVEGIDFRNFTGNGARAVWILGSGSNVLVQNCTISNIGWVSNNLSLLPPNNGTVANAIKVEGSQAAAWKNVRLQNNRIHNCATGWGEAVTVTGNVDSFFVENNVVDSIANIGIVAAGNYSSTGAPTGVNQARRGFIRGNTVSNCMSGIAVAAGIYADGAVNCVIEGNRIYQCGTGISVGGEKPVGAGAVVPGNHSVMNNLVYSNVLSGAVLGTNNGTFAAQNFTLFNNTFYHNRTGAVINGITTVGGVPVAQEASDFGGELLLQNVSGVLQQNNIVYPQANKRALVALSDYTVSNYAANYNLYYKDGTAPLFELTGNSFNGVVLMSAYTDIAAFAAATGLEGHSVFGSPGFTNAAANIFTLLPGALAIDKGNPAYNPSLSGVVDYAGNARVYNNVRIDAGAYEYRDSVSYIFTGNGNWTAAANWQGGLVPPQPLPGGQIIVINPAAGGECVINTAQTISPAATLLINPGARLRLAGNLSIGQ